MAQPPSVPTPPAGSTFDSPYSQFLGPTYPDLNDPAFQPPTDPLKQGNLRSRAKLIYRELPLITIQNSWTVAETRSALQLHSQGTFELSAQLVESVLGDDRVQATVGSRTGGLFGQPIRMKPAELPRVKGSDAAKECLEAWQDAWPRIAPQADLEQVHTFGFMLGAGPAQTVWDTEGPVWIPQLRFWHPRYVYFHWEIRRFVAISEDGQYPIIPGDGKWFLHVPHGEYRGWMRGAVRAVAEPWLIRHFAYRDWARFSEVHGLPIRKGKVPAASDPVERSAFENSLAALGNDTAIIVPTGVDGVNGYDLELVEATDQAWQSFPGLIDRCDMSIVLAILFQNLTTEVKEGSFAAARVHGDVRQGALEADNVALSRSIYQQLARPFAEINFGDPDLAPCTDWDIVPREDYQSTADLLAKFGSLLNLMHLGGVKFSDEGELQRFVHQQLGLPIPRVEYIKGADSITGDTGNAAPPGDGK